MDVLSRLIPSVPPDTIIYVLEMNNSTNKIMGIGRIKNKKYAREKIYKSGEYNRHVYKGALPQRCV